MDVADRQPTRVGQSGPSPILFWMLLALAVAVFVPCVVLPVWRDYQAMDLALQVEERLTAAARTDVDRQRRTADGIRTDPAVATRLARRELGFTQPDQTDVPVPGTAPAAAHPGAMLPLEPATPPPVVARALAHLPTMDYDRLFRQEPTRTILMLLSGGLVAAAVTLCRPKAIHPASDVSIAPRLAGARRKNPRGVGPHSRKAGKAHYAAQDSNL